MYFKPHDYQNTAINFILDNPVYCEDDKGLGAIMEMGLGKTVCVLTAFNELKYDRYEVNKMLVIAPLRVAEDTWIKEAAKWDHTKHLRISRVLGTERQRLLALKQEADIYVINRENVLWLVGQYSGKKMPFDMLVVDELSSFKSPKSNRFKALKPVLPLFKRIVGLTGTIMPNGMPDLWAQIYLLDKGKRLGKTITSYRDTYLKPDKRNGMTVFSYKLKVEADVVFDKIKDICMSMKVSDYLTMPPYIETVVDCDMGDMLQQYKSFEKDLIINLPDGDQVTALTAAALNGKLRQFANGAIYKPDKTYEVIHDCKLDRIVEDIEFLEGKPVLLFYQFKHDLERLLVALKRYHPRKLIGSSDINEWNDKKIPILLAHPLSAAHGLNLQAGGNNMMWFGLDYNLELRMQALARIMRQGQQNTVFNRDYLSKGTIDYDIKDALEGKKAPQEALMQYIKAKKKEYGL
jgi:SNF2 family DNA or RNA helicase